MFYLLRIMYSKCFFVKLLMLYGTTLVLNFYKHNLLFLSIDCCQKLWNTLFVLVLFVIIRIRCIFLFAIYIIYYIWFAVKLFYSDSDCFVFKLESIMYILILMLHDYCNIYVSLRPSGLNGYTFRVSSFILPH